MEARAFANSSTKDPLYTLRHNQKCPEIAGHYFVALDSQIVS
jgi:hypothetical protein